MTQLKAGLHPVTNEKFVKLGVPIDLIGQVIGDAPLSSGYHAVDGQFSRTMFPDYHCFNSDGTINTTSEWVDYCAAVDLRPAHYDLTGANKPMDREAIYQFVSAAALLGICAFFRHPGFDGTPTSWPEHIHLVDAGVKMKPQLSEQVHDFRLGLNGLAGHGKYSFYQCSQYASNVIHSQWLQANGGGQ